MVLPIYRRPKFDGLLIRNLVFPMAKSLYGCGVREPYPTDFAFSGDLGSHFLSQDIWNQEQGRRGTELWMTLWAAIGKRKLVQSFLGTKTRREDAPSDLVGAMRETAGTLFTPLDAYSPVWHSTPEPVEAPCLGCEPAVSDGPSRLNRKRLYDMFRFGIKELDPVFLSILTSSTHDELKRLAGLPEDKFSYSGELWARTAYEFANAFHRTVIGRDHIVQALVPLFRGRAHTFLTENREASPEGMEENVESLCQAFEHEKPRLVELWDGGK
jgi:hypothetical protein